MNKKKMRSCSLILYLSALVSVLVMLLLIRVNEGAERYQLRSEPECETVEEYECFVEKKVGTPLELMKIYTWKLPDKIQGDTSLAFYFVHQYVRVYLENELVYSIFPISGKHIGKTLGCDWVFVPLLQEDEGKSIRVEIIPVYSATVNREPEFFIGSKLGIYTKQAENDKWQIIMSVLSVIIGVIFLGIGGYYIILKKPKEDLLALGTFSVMLGIWRLADTRFSPLLFRGNASFLFYLSVAMLMLGTVPMLKMLQANNYKKEYIVTDVLCGILSLLCITLTVFQMLGIVDVRQVLTVIHIVILAALLIVIILVVYDYFKYRNREKQGILWICVVGVILDVIAYYIKGNSSGLFFSLSAFQIYVLCTGIITINGYIVREKKISEQEAELAENRVAIMLSQIQPHFLYNSLTSIYYLCGKDSDAARRAIKDFADYLRGNMDSLKQKTPVAFEVELKHIEIYLSLEKMRFDEELQIEYDVEVKDFRIPSLTVQPLVENAVKYGVGKSPHGGTIVISTREYRDRYEVTVADDGVGYDVNKKQDDGRTHIGIANVKSRLWEMSRATLNIVSVVGEGTTAIITIPKQMK